MSISLEAKVDLMLALLQEQSTKVNTLVKKYGLISEIPKWVTVGELAEITNAKSVLLPTGFIRVKFQNLYVRKKKKEKFITG